jgi:hypothetical protein
MKKFQVLHCGHFNWDSEPQRAQIPFGFTDEAFANAEDLVRHVSNLGKGDENQVTFVLLEDGQRFEETLNRLKCLDASVVLILSGFMAHVADCTRAAYLFHEYDDLSGLYVFAADAGGLINIDDAVFSSGQQAVKTLSDKFAAKVGPRGMSRNVPCHLSYCAGDDVRPFQLLEL